MRQHDSHPAGLRRAETWKPETRPPAGTAYRGLAILALLLALVVVSLGAYVRLSDAGLGCPDWPGCYGKLVGVPEQAHEVSHAEASFGKPVEAPKAWKEMIHRYAAGTLGLCILALAITAWRRRARRRPWLELALLGVVMGQALLGMLTVTRLLKPVIVTSHLLGGMTTLALLALLVLREGRPPRPAVFPAGLKILAVLATAAVLGQIALGGWVSSNYAATICADFPTCQGSFSPDTDFHHAFTLDRELGSTASGELLPAAALTAIHWTHRLFACVVLTLAGLFSLCLLRRDGGRRHGLALLTALALQIGLGIANVLLQLPLPLAVAHNTGAALLLCAVLAATRHVLNGEKAPHRHAMAGFPRRFQAIR
ncbi:COX15/CtaA family protein [Zoogloea sp.]|uniref:COX15/CtaA family protein n=1 Tax=Zoogloea sp. TaxID=49181 RepID=UPI001416B92D|nr:MAG: heme A synthase [Zoogloea sp.]